MAIYLDHQASTPTDPRVVDAMLPWFTERVGNPHAEQHSFGRQAAAAIDHARQAIAALIGCHAAEIVLTAGATESNALALRGAAWAARQSGRDHVVALTTEHASVLKQLETLASEGTRVSRVPVGRSGLVDLDRLAETVDERTALVSVMAAHNEIGVIQPLADIGALCRARGALFHTDAAQAFGKMALDVDAMAIDLLSLSGHKIYGPMGIGALYVRRKPAVRLTPLLVGGGQQRGLRAGTVPTPLAVGLGEAAAIAAAEREAEARRLTGLTDRLLARLRRQLGALYVNGDMDRRLPGSLNLLIPGVPAEDLMEAVPDLAISTGAACQSADGRPSAALLAIGLRPAEADCSIRIGLGRFTTVADVDTAARRLGDAVAGLIEDERRAAE